MPWATQGQSSESSATIQTNLDLSHVSCGLGVQDLGRRGLCRPFAPELYMLNSKSYMTTCHTLVAIDELLFGAHASIS